MARTKISEFSATPGNNTDIDGINIAEGCAPSGINDAIRELMSQLKDFQAGTAGDSFNGPVGTTTAAAGAFTTLSASSTVSGTGFSNYLASPPAIGGTAAAAGSFTTLSASSTVTLSGGTANGVLYLNASKVATSGSALTFDGTTLYTTAAVRGAGGFTFAGSSTGSAAGPTLSGGYSSGAGYAFLQGYDWTAGTFQPLALTGSNIQFLAGSSPSEQMRLTSTGLGVGTSSPGVKLDVVGTGDTSLRARTTGTVNSASVLIYNGNGTTAAGYSYLRFVNDDTNTQDWRIGTYGNNNLSIVNAKAGTTPVVLDTSGNLGIGTSSPQRKIHGYITTGPVARMQTVGSNAAIEYVPGATDGSGTIYNWVVGAQYNVGNAFEITPSTAAGGLTFSTPAVVVTSGGNVGIGTSSPGGKLDIYQNSARYVRAYPSSGLADFEVVTNNNVQPVFAVKGTGTADLIRAYAGATQAFTLDSSGNLGLGGTPNGYGSAYTTLTINNATTGAVLDLNVAGTRTGTLFATVNETRLASVTNIPLVLYTNNTERARIDSSGRLLVGTTSVQNSATCTVLSATSANSVYAAHNSATSGDNSFIWFGTEAGGTTRGSITYNRGGGVVAYNTTSDYRAKDIIGPVVDPGATIDALKVYMGKMKGATIERPMMIAHEAQAETPYAVTGEKDAVNDDGTPKYQQMDHQVLVPLLIAELQSLRKRVAQLEGK